MKRNLLIIILIGLAIAAAATDADPLQSYLEEQSTATFRAAVNALSDSLVAASDPNTHKAYLAYIASNEANRLLDELQEDPDSLSAGQRFMVGNMLLALEKYSAAIGIYDGLNKDFPKWSCPWRHKGEALFRTKDYAAAVSALDEAIKTNTEHYDAYVWRAMAGKELGQLADALRDLETAMKLDPNGETGEDDIISADEVKALYQEISDLLKQTGQPR